MSAETEATDQKPEGQGRLLLVSNRLPITIKRSDDGKYDTSMSSGGLVSGLSGLSKATTFQWYGWPGIQIPDDEIEDVKKTLKEEYNAIPIMLEDELADKHYNGFSSEHLLQLITLRGS
jgi:trehalose 6-phosphate synthase